MNKQFEYDFIETEPIAKLTIGTTSAEAVDLSSYLGQWVRFIVGDETHVHILGAKTATTADATDARWEASTQHRRLVGRQCQHVSIFNPDGVSTASVWVVKSSAA